MNDKKYVAPKGKAIMSIDEVQSGSLSSNRLKSDINDLSKVLKDHEDSINELITDMTEQADE